MKTAYLKKSEVKNRWLLVDAENQILGRMATRVASLLRGKETPAFTPNVDTGDFVVVVNAEKVRLTGKKWSDKIYYHHSGYIGGIKEHTAARVREMHPTELIRHAVRGMLPRGPLGYHLLKKLKVYAGVDHPHQAQNPVRITIEGKP
jgi:large subunit ribosomal protein L13